MVTQSTAASVLQRLRAHMTEHGLQVCVVSLPIHVGYLCGYFPPANRFAALLVTAAEATLVAPSSGAPAPTADPSFALCAYEDYAIARTVDPAADSLAAFDEALRALRSGAPRLGWEPAYLPAAYGDRVRAVLSPALAEDVSPLLQAWRAIKTPAEVQAIARAVAATDDIFAAVERSIHVGSSELDVYVAAVGALTRAAGGPAVLDGDFVSGPRAEQIGGPPTERRLEPGDLLIVDVYPAIAGYWADTTRTFSVGTPSQAVVDRHGVLEDALAAGERAIAAGLPARELYNVVKGVIERAGYGAHFPHHAGHCVGVTPSEDPRLIPGSDAVLQEGMVITLEPGIYLPGGGGMRLEDNYLVTADGCRSLSHYPRKLVVI